MRKVLVTFIYLLLAGTVWGQASRLPVIDPDIIGRWDYLKTVKSDGTEEFMNIGREHYYSDGTVIFVNMFVKPYSPYRIPKTHQELATAFESYHSGLGTFETNLHNNVLRIHLISTADTSSLGLIYDFGYKIEDDILIFDDQYYFRRAKD
jgi:hypothetical protein